MDSGTAVLEGAASPEDSPPSVPLSAMETPSSYSQFTADEETSGEFLSDYSSVHTSPEKFENAALLLYG